jgi:hypothetical protein
MNSLKAATRRIIGKYRITRNILIGCALRHAENKTHLSIVEDNAEPHEVWVCLGLRVENLVLNTGPRPMKAHRLCDSHSSPDSPPASP